MSREPGQVWLLRPKNWRSFQHYKDRNPVWIKLHHSLLDDYEFQGLPVASRALAPMLWLLASEKPNGEISGTSLKLSFRLRMTEKDFNEAIIPLIEIGLFECEKSASTVISRVYHNAMPEERRGETETETETDLLKRSAHDNEFNLIFWPEYPTKNGKREAFIAFHKARNKTPLSEIMDGLRRYNEFLTFPNAPQPKYAQGWLNGERWRDENHPPKNGNGHATGPITTLHRAGEKVLAVREERRRREAQVSGDIAKPLLAGK